MFGTLEVLESRRLLATTYTLADLGESNLNSTYPIEGISRVNNTFMSGAAPVTLTERHAVLVKGKTFTELVPLTKTGDSFAWDVSETGTVVGESDTETSGILATAWVGAKPVNLGAGVATAISSNGSIIVGTREVATSQPNVFADHAFIFGKKAKDLGTLGGVISQSEARDVNNAGWVVGRSDDEFGRSLPFYYNGKGVFAIKAQFTNGVANAINEAGVIVGHLEFNAFAFNTKTKALKILKPAPVSTFDDIGVALDVNNSGMIIGYTQNGANVYATVWEGGVPFDLNKLIRTKTNFKMEYAKSINDKGQILVVGTDGLDSRAFLLTPNRAAVSSTGTLRISGSPVADSVGVAVKGSKINVTVNGGTQSFSKSTIKRLSIDLGEGSDTLTLGTGLPAANVLGRGGNDTFNVRNGVKDVLDGGTGSDKAQVDRSDSRTLVETLLA